MEGAGKTTASDGRAARTVFLVSVIVTGVLYAIPYGQYIAYPLLLLSTLVHELGHGVSAVLMGGNFEEFKMWADGSGVAMHTGHLGAVQSAVVSAGGLVGPALAAAVGMGCARKAKAARGFLLILGLGLVVAEVLVVRNLFGLVFVGVLAALCLGVALKAGEEVAQAVVIFLSVQLALSVFSRSDYLFTDVAQTSGGTMPSDVAQMANALVGPYWFWGAVCAAFSLVVLAGGAFALLRPKS